MALAYRDTQSDGSLVYTSSQYEAGAISPAPASVAMAGNAPVINQGVSIAPAASTVTGVGFTPALNQGFSIAPASGAIVLAVAAPSIVRGQSISPSPTLVTAAGSAPTLTQPLGLSPSPAGVVAISPAPEITGPLILMPAARAIVVRGQAPGISQPQAARTISIKQDDLLRVIKAFILSLVTQPVLRTPVNRASMPKGSFVAMSPGRVKALATNSTSGMRNVKRPSQFDCQIDCYGIDAGDTAAMLSIMFRDQYAIEVFESQPLEIVPLYANDAQQMPIVTGEEQYLERWTFEIALQFNPVVSMPAQSANMLELSLRNVTTL